MNWRTCGRNEEIRARIRAGHGFVDVAQAFGISRQRVEQIYRKDRSRARAAVSRAIKRGDLVRPEQCEACFGNGSIDSHHPDYSKPLAVEWLCKPCHVRADADRRRARGEERRKAISHFDQQVLRAARSTRVDTPTKVDYNGMQATAEGSKRMCTLWKIGDVADFLGVTESAVRSRVARRQIPHVKIGGSLRFDPLEIAAWIHDNAVGIGSGELYGSGG